MLLFLILLLLLNTFQIIFLLMSLSFHKRAFLFRKTPSAIKEIDGNIQRPKTQGQSETQKQNKICCGNKLEKHEQKLAKDITNDFFNQQMKQLIAKNYQYFQNKMKICQSNKPNNHRFKIPFKTGTTTYKKQYLKRNNSCQPLDRKTFPMKKTNCKFNGTSTYQNSFLPRQNDNQDKTSKNQKNCRNAYKENDSPAFMETSYKNQFLNWGGKNVITSMKPTSNPATSGLPFKGSSIYKADFNKKDSHPAEKITQQSSFPKSANITMPYSSNYKGEFTPKKCDKQNNCKPSNTYVDTGFGFKGNTQYRGQFNNVNPKSKQKTAIDYQWKDKSIKQIQTLMMSL